MIFNNHQEFLNYIKQQCSSVNLEYNLMSLDIGEKKIGLAICHSQLKVAVPYQVLTRKNIKQDITTLKSTIQEKSISGLVIGLPISKSGASNANTEKVVKFAKYIEKNIKVPITFYDERFSTRLANTMLLEVNMKRKKRNQIDDEISATLILSDFLKLNWGNLG